MVMLSLRISLYKSELELTLSSQLSQLSIQHNTAQQEDSAEQLNGRFLNMMVVGTDKLDTSYRTVG